ncbi:unnamed protein product [Ixodes persulcatus]
MWWRVRWRYGGSRHCRGKEASPLAFSALSAFCSRGPSIIWPWSSRCRWTREARRRLTEASA